MRRIAFDAMGGDQAPEVELDTAAAILREAHADVGLILVGDERRLRAGLERRGATTRSPRIEIRHAPQVVTMDDPPAAAVRGKRLSSMRVAFDLVKAGEADAIVSAGNSGAMLACGMLVLKRLPGALRPGIVTKFPTLQAECVLCDMGANVDVQPPILAQFGILGAAYAQAMLGRARPRIGLLSNGEEAHKGTELTRGAHAILGRIAAAGADLEYAGYVEGRHIFDGDLDVVATDGFTGNVVLKTSEGAAYALVEMLKRAFRSSRRATLGALLAAPALRKFKKSLDYAEVGGAPLLGVNGLVLVCHGRSSAHALKNAIYTAARYAERGLTSHVAQVLARHREILEAAEAEAAANPSDGRRQQGTTEGARGAVRGVVPVERGHE